MPLTPRFHELIEELDLPEAAWHLSRTNTWTEIHATEEEIEKGKETILALLQDKGDCVTRILAQIESDLEKLDPLNILLKKRPLGAPFDGDIAKRLGLEKRKKQAQLILEGRFQVIQGEGAGGNNTSYEQRFVVGERVQLQDAA